MFQSRGLPIKALAIGSTLLLVACEQILGLDQFQKCGTCDAGADAPDDAGDASNDAIQLPDGVTEASSWANWIMENTATEVFEGGAPINTLRNLQPTMLDSGVSVIFDPFTKLAWDLSIGAQTSEFAQAFAYCQGRGERLPTRIELATLLDSTRGAKLPHFAPELDPALTDAGSPGRLWTSSYARPVTSPIGFWYGDVGSGDMKTLGTTSAGVLCVR